MEEAYRLLYQWINHYDYEKVRNKYIDIYKDNPDQFNRKFDLIIQMQNDIIKNLKADRERIEYYFKERNSNYCTLASLALLLDLSKMEDVLSGYEERIKPLSLADRIFLIAVNVNDEEIMNTNKERLACESDLIAFLEAVDLDAYTKWEAIKIFNNQETYYNEVSGILRETMELLESKYTKTINTLSLEFYDYWNSCMENIDVMETLSDRLKISWKMSETGCVIAPMIFSPYQISIAMDPDNRTKKDLIRIGIAIDKNFTLLIDKSLKKEDIVEIGKLFSDKSKVDILELVSRKPCYGKELANALDLSTATISYHVNALLKEKFIKAEIISNKIYYSINKERISAQLDGIKRFFDGTRNEEF